MSKKMRQKKSRKLRMKLC